MNATVDKVITETINGLDAELRQISIKIHDNPELGEHEFNASHLLCNYLEGKGFRVTRGAAGMPTAFIAEYANSTKGRRMGYCSEFDALPGVGHACGHNLIAISGLACAIATKALLEHGLIEGSVVLYGTPAEESTSGKITFVQKGEVQSRVDVAMMLHPGPANGVFVKMLALDALKVEFFGKASHAGMKPWDGINALDAFMQGWNNVSMLRQQTLTTNRVHGIITDGGKSANVIPDYAAGRFYCRAVTRAQLREFKEKVENCFKAAAGATQCQLKLTWAPYGAIDDVFQNSELGYSYIDYMKQEGAQFFPRSVEETVVSGSTDMGNFSYVVPTLHPGFEIGTTAANHTVEFTKAARTPEAHQYTLRAARSLSRTAASVFLDDSFYERVRAEFLQGKPQ
ncbi:hypothetical protein BDB00DRAFT_766227 [Zychaea mexicana]|uniref:uncharacterized protein n=1 Tax=Zychaea mexicana TaxID=64656 RepID=UPI0022FEAC21|nr:uncharacterized protein BDB00DRAFT_766227 [Zychaea mexicana]KAI9492013.1 hypothetical protein BDB00DRAFT_766227 [Zychaea mexicana]